MSKTAIHRRPSKVNLRLWKLVLIKNKGIGICESKHKKGKNQSKPLINISGKKQKKSTQYT